MTGAALILGLSLSAACTSDSPRGSADSTTGLSPAPQVCDLVDLSRIRADTTNRVKPADLTARQRSGIRSHDDRSFVARVTVAQLVDAGVNTGRLPLTERVLLYVNHGDWSPNDFAISRPPGINPVASASPTPDPRIAWNVSVLTDELSGSFSMYVPDNECFRG